MTNFEKELKKLLYRYNEDFNDEYLESSILSLHRAEAMKARIDELEHLDTNDDGHIFYIDVGIEIHRDDRIATLKQLKGDE